MQPKQDDTTVSARYTLDKFQAFTAYSSSASTGRVLAVLLLTPVMTVLGSLLLPLVPLRDPNEGLQKNLGGFVTHLMIISWLSMFGASIQFRAGAHISHDEYSTPRIALASLVGALLLAALAVVTCALWRFPIPFFWVFFAGPCAVCMLLGHLIVSRGSLLGSPELRRKFRRYLPTFTLQVSQIVIYPVLSAAFGSRSQWQQVALTLAFPVIKHILKKFLRSLTHPLADFAEEAAISDVEICAALYQSMIMQTRPSPYTTAFVIGVDFVLGVAAVKRLTEKRSIVPQREIISTATAVVKQHKQSLDDAKLDTYATPRQSPFIELWARCQSVLSLRERRVSVARVGSVMAPVALPTDGDRTTKDGVVLVHALEILQAAESILLVEYLEVAIPVVSAIYLAVATQFASAVYDPRLYGFYYHRERILPAIASLAMYTGLQLIGMVLMTIGMQLRFRVSPLLLLAFHLEHHAWSLQGKMLAWLAVLMQFSMLHYGADFSFNFQFKVPTVDD